MVRFRQQTTKPTVWQNTKKRSMRTHPKKFRLTRPEKGPGRKQGVHSHLVLILFLVPAALLLLSSSMLYVPGGYVSEASSHIFASF